MSKLFVTLLLIVLAIMVIFFTFELLPMEVTALATIGILWFLGILTIEEAISGFGNKAVITIGTSYAISGIVSFCHSTIPCRYWR